MLLTYFLLTGSRHPFFIHLTRSQNFMTRVNIAFMTGLIFVPVPVIYTLGYVGLVMGHLFLRRIGYYQDDLKNDVKDILKLLIGTKNEEKRENNEQDKNFNKDEDNKK